MFNFNRKEKGQGLVEYALILVLIAIVVIAAMQALGTTVDGTFTNVNSTLGGDGSSEQSTACTQATQQLSIVQEQYDFCMANSATGAQGCIAQKNTLDSVQSQKDTACSG